MSVYERPHEHGLPNRRDDDLEDDDWETDPEPAVPISFRLFLLSLLPN